MDEPLSPDASAVLTALLDGPGPVLAALRAQVPYVRVTGRCGCGCVTVDLEVDRGAVAAAPGHDRPVVEAGYADDEYGAGVLLFTAEGYVSGLEIYSASGDPVTEWPDAAGLEIERRPGFERGVVSGGG
ncbi:hypothetical protein GCM10010329_03770 [Streptomyces spiroverticillatus]|uniref:Uncharacterized protein n=1 Tax=Streptomyces finlayi TaxID=67296 RepID=A0A918WSG2_9ACTN|nr:hypothetical protein [Streptomyces finlayi]GGZ87096.1 hypothetical protein GCM10010329_03770 [Streptomyces spiroverticillatus]GHC78457.1 hypothetical protein GCM10010334_03750 [Streptomyces finlayi]